MATFHKGTLERKGKNRSGDSPYHIFTPDDTQLQGDILSTFHPRQVQHQGPSTTKADSFKAILPLHYTNTEDSFSSSLPQHGSQRSNTSGFLTCKSYRNRSIDNVTASVIKSLPPRGKYNSPTTYTTPSFTKNLPQQQGQQTGISSYMSSFPRHGSATNTESDFASYREIDYPLDIVNDLEYDRLQPDERRTLASNVVHSNAAYESVVRRPFAVRGSNSPVFNIQLEQEQDYDDDLGSTFKLHTHGRNTSEISGDDDSKKDTKQLKVQDGQYKDKTASPLPQNDYENVKEFVPYNRYYGDHASIPQLEPKLLHFSNMEHRNLSGLSEVEIQQGKENSAADQYKPDYENVKEYYSQRCNMECADNPEWIPLVELPNTVPQMDMELNECPALVPNIVVEEENMSSIEDLSEYQNADQTEQSGASLGKDLRKSVDLETLSDYEEMASSFSSHYTAIKSNQQAFQFLSSTEIEVAQDTEQDDDDKQIEDTTNPLRDTPQNKQTSTDRSDKLIPKKRKAKAFQYCLIFITLAIAIAALVLSTLLYLKSAYTKPESNCPDCIVSPNMTNCTTAN